MLKLCKYCMSGRVDIVKIFDHLCRTSGGWEVPSRTGYATYTDLLGCDSDFRNPREVLLVLQPPFSCDVLTPTDSSF
jgi:hypothetical protein